MKLKMPVPNTMIRLGLLFMIIKTFFSSARFFQMPDLLDTVLSVIASSFLLGSILQKRYPLKVLLTFALTAMLGLVTSVRTGNMMIFIAIISCLAMCGEDLNDAIRFMLFTEALFVVIFALISFGMQLLGYDMFVRVSGEMRYGFGFSHPNVFSCVLTNLFAMYLWLYFDTVRPGNLFVICLIELFAYICTTSRTGLVVTLFLVMLVALCRNQKPQRFISITASCVIPVMTVVFYLLCKGYVSGNLVARFVDKILSKRVLLGAYSLEHFGVSLFGQNISGTKVVWDEFWRLNSITFDNIYTFLLVTQFIWLLVIMVLFYLIAKKGDKKQSIFILCWALYGVSEVHVINPVLFFVILIISGLFDGMRRGEPVAK